MSCKKTGTLEWAQKNVNFKKGCKNNCVYCYAAKMANRFGWKPRAEWHLMEDAKPKSLPRNTTVMMPSSHDLVEEDLPTIEQILLKLLNRGNHILLVSKPRKAVIQPLLDTLGRVGNNNVEFRFSITSSNPEISLRYEPGAPLPQERVDCLKMVLDAGFPASVSMEPYLEPPENIFRMLFENAVFFDSLKEIWVGAMNYGAPTELKPLYTQSFMETLWSKWKKHDRIYWKDSYQKVLGIDPRGRKLP